MDSILIIRFENSINNVKSSQLRLGMVTTLLWVVKASTSLWVSKIIIRRNMLNLLGIVNCLRKQQLSGAL